MADAHSLALGGLDWSWALVHMEADLRRMYGEDFIEHGVVHPITHTLDLAYGHHCTAQVARALGDKRLADDSDARSRLWVNAFDPVTGLLRDSEYYEGGKWNYSFRLLHDMRGRITLAGGDDAFVDMLDSFFGFGAGPVTQPVRRPTPTKMVAGYGLNRFEGLTNEPDMEAPWAYHYAGRPDRSSEIVNSALTWQFGTGTHVPRAEAARVVVARQLQAATLNGPPLDTTHLRAADVHNGGVLHLELGSEPSPWGRSARPLVIVVRADPVICGHSGEARNLAEVALTRGFDDVRLLTWLPGLVDRVVFLTDVDDDEKPLLMHGCATYALPTKPEPDFVETFGIALAEKLLNGGGPVITTLTGGTGESVGDTAVIVEAGNVAALADALDRWCSRCPSTSGAPSNGAAASTPCLRPRQGLRRSLPSGARGRDRRPGGTAR